MNSDQPAGSALRMLVAFTLGMLAMAAVAVVAMLPMLRNKGSEERAAIPSEAEPVVTEATSAPQPPPPARMPNAAVTGAPPRNVRPAPASVNSKQSLQEAIAATKVSGERTNPINNSRPAFIIHADTPDAPRHLNIGGIWRQGGGVISGKITLKGVQPRENPIALRANDPCGKLPNPPVMTRFYRVGPEQGLGDVLIFLSEGVRGGPWALNAKSLPLFYTGCQIEPHVSAMQVGQKILVHNLDDLMHNVHFMVNRPNKEVNKVQMAGSGAIELEVAAPELFARLKCDVHPWEFGYVSIFDHPFFAVTMEDGLFQLEGVPLGDYVVKVIHRKGGTQEKRIRVHHNGPFEANFTFETVEL
jgi:hypothetical protein